MLPLTLFLAFLIPAPAAQEAEPGQCFVKDGKTAGVFYGMSVLMDLWGNFRRQVSTLRPDGVYLFGAPEGGFEDFVKRPLSATEKPNATQYRIEGEKFFFSYRDGSKSEGKVEYNADGSIKKINASGLNFYPLHAGVPGELTGYWTNTVMFNNGALKMSTTAYSSYSFFAGGIFVLESGASTIATAVQTRTRETSSTIETIREEVTRFYGNDPKSKMGRFEVKGSSLNLTYDNGTKESRYIGRLGEMKPGESGFLIIGNGLYDGTLGVFPKSAAPAPGAAPAAAAPPPGLARCRNAQFDLAVPEAWRAREQDADGLKAFLIVPADAAESQLTIVLTSLALDDRKMQASDPGMLASLEVLATSWCKNEKIKRVGDPAKFRIGEADAVLLRFSVVREGGNVVLEAACAVRDGNALVALTVAGEDAEKKYGAAARELLGKAVIAAGAPEAKVELQRVKGEGYELDIPKAWTSKAVEQSGTKTILIVPPPGEAEYVVQIIPTEAGTHESATAPAAVQELHDLVKQLAPALKLMGDVETLKASGRPASGVVYGGRNEKNETILVKAYLALKDKQAVVLLVVGKEAHDKEFGALVRKSLESLSFK